MLMIQPFLMYIISAKHVVDTFLFFSYFSRLKPNLTKSEIAGIGVLKRAQVYSMSCIILNIDKLKILGTYFSLNRKLKEEKKFYVTV